MNMLFEGGNHSFAAWHVLLPVTTACFELILENANLQIWLLSLRGISLPRIAFIILR